MKRLLLVVTVLTHFIFLPTFAESNSDSGETINQIIHALESNKKTDDNSKDSTPTEQTNDNKIVKLFESIYGDFDKKTSKNAMYSTIGIAILGLFLLRNSTILGLTMIVAPTTVYYFIQKIIKMMG